MNSIIFIKSIRKELGKRKYVIIYKQVEGDRDKLTSEWVLMKMNKIVVLVSNKCGFRKLNQLSLQDLIWICLMFLS